MVPLKYLSVKDKLGPPILTREVATLSCDIVQSLVVFLPHSIYESVWISCALLVSQDLWALYT